MPDRPDDEAPEQAEPHPSDPFTGLDMGSVYLHETFASYVAAGFTEPQALYLVAAQLTGGPKAPPT